MPIHIDDDPERTLLDFVESWFRLLARGEWDKALHQIDRPNSYGIRWSRESIVTLVNETFNAESRFVREFGTPFFSDPAQAAGTSRHSFGTSNDGGFWLDYDVPLGGQFSDLTAQFEFLPSTGSSLLVVLHDLHVM